MKHGLTDTVAKDEQPSGRVEQPHEETIPQGTP